MVTKYPSQVVIGGTSAWIGPHHLEIDPATEFGNLPPATEIGDALPPQPSAMKDLLLLRIHHGP